MASRANKPLSNEGCFLHGDIDCNLCYNASKPRRRPVRPTRLPRVSLINSGLSLEERVNLKVLAPILHVEELTKHPQAEEPLTEEELEYLIQNRL